MKLYRNYIKRMIDVVTSGGGVGGAGGAVGVGGGMVAFCQ